MIWMIITRADVGYDRDYSQQLTVISLSQYVGLSA